MNPHKQLFYAHHVAFIVRLPARHDRFNEFEKSLTAIAERMAQEPDFLGAWLHRDADDPDTFVFYERWACSKEDFLERHLKKEYRVAYESELAGFLKAPRTIEFLNTHRVWAQFPSGTPQ